MRTLITTMLIGCLAAAVLAATPTDRINYEGVLRDSANNPVNATHDVIFRIFDAETLGNEMIVDEHLVAGTGGVTFDNGLFNAAIGGGNVLDGSGPGFYDSLRNVFRDYGTLWLELQVDGETLSPRLPIYAAGHALNSQHAEQADNATNATSATNASQADNADALNGLPASNFIDTTASTQTKSGGLTVNGVLTLGDTLASTVGGKITPGIDIMRIEAGVDNTDRVWLVAGNDNSDGRVEVNGDSGIGLWAGDGTVSFGRADTSEVLMTMAPSGNLSMDGDLTVDGQDIFLGQARLQSFLAGGLTLQAGDSVIDDLSLQAGSGSANGRIMIQGNASMLLESGNGVFSFRNNGGTELAGLNASGDLQIDGNLTVDGGTTTHSGNLQVDGTLVANGDDIDLGSGANIWANAGSMTVAAGDSDDDDLFLQAGNGSDGRIAIVGGGEVRYEPGNGLHRFYDGNGGEKASLNNLGNLQIDGDLTVSGNNLDFGFGSRIEAFSSSVIMYAGDAAGDDLYLRGGNSPANGQIRIFGNDEIWFESASGDYRFFDGASTEVASVNSVGDIQLDGDLWVSGGSVNYGNGALLTSGSTLSSLRGGTDATDDLRLQATGSTANGYILINGGASISFVAGNGDYFFSSGGSTTGFLDSTGNLDLDGKLDLDGGEIFMIETGVDQNQDLHFREDGLASGERFQWDNAADRFEVSDDFHVFGTLTATTKNFVQNHPYRDDLEVVYTSLEGDEATAFTRGFGRLENGEARIALGETFAYVVNPDLGLSAYLTPRGEWADLYVVELTPTQLVVGAAPGSPDVAFDFMVLGLRIGHEDFPVLRPKRAEAFLPAAEQYDEDRGFDEDLASAAALSRYRRMAEQAGLGEIDFSRAESLKAAIGQRLTQFDYPVGSELSVAQILLAENGADGDDLDIVMNEPAMDVAQDASPSAADVPRSEVQTATAAGAPTESGDIYADSFRPKASEVATMLPSGETLSGGDVVTIDPISGRMVLAREATDSTVFGVVAAEPGVILGARQPDGDAEPSDDVPVAMSGIVLCKVDASYGAIRPGDLLTTSETAGYAMRAETAVAGAILGKALEPMDVGSGLIRVLVTLR